jgi:chemotaxis protein methyltransferase CheR
VNAAEPAMSQEEYLLLNELISDRFGICFPEHRRDALASRLRPRLRTLSLRRYWDYYLQIQSDPRAEGERLAELVTNNETFFFRETQPMEEYFAAAACAAPRRGSPLRLLSAGCSSGEEPYTLAIQARRQAFGPGPGGLAVDAFDLDRTRLATARRAEYGRHSLRALADSERGQYFTPLDGDRWALRAPFRDGVRFAWGNLLDLATFQPAEPYDAVFCRNVLIYFAEGALYRAIRNFAAVLRPGGLLFLGTAESIIGMSDDFETIRLGRTIAYRRVAA